MQKAIRIPNIEGWILTDRGILNTNEISCVMELRCESGERWVCVEEIDVFDLDTSKGLCMKKFLFCIVYRGGPIVTGKQIGRAHV